ncbi:unnamed protein product [Adineta steineri]|uniref:Uncharacterized protein n=1 Tax=Adineta steineri TaxID=433720 RepID=A0A814T6T4_9BILA|nr:unnamed protein product [Adineta steineri]
MSTNRTLTLHTLPVELIYCILDNLDDLTIILSLRNVCLQLNAIIDIYPRYQALTTLNLRGNNISAIGAKYLAQAIQNNTTLTTLNLDINSIGDEGVQHLALALQNNTTLTTLSLQINNIRAEGAHYLAIALQCNQTLTTLNLQNNCILEEGARYLINALRSNNSIQHRIMSTMTNSSNPATDVCSICLGALVQPNMDLFTTACQHQFHFVCLAKSVEAQNHECPLCRTRLDSLSSIIHTPVQIAPIPIQVPAQAAAPVASSSSSSSTAPGLWFTLKRSLNNAYSWMSKSSSSNSTEDLVNEAVVRALSGRIQAARQRAANGTTELELITATTTLEFGGQVSTQASNIYGMVTLKSPSLLPITASEKELNELRVPIDLVCIVDISGSMQGEKITLLKKTLDYIIDQMGPLDRLAMVSFDTAACNRSNGLNMMTHAKQQTLHNAVAQSIHAGGGTYIGSGLEMGIQILTSRRTKNPVGAMLLLTDGQDNQHHDYSQLMQTLPDGVVCHTFGYGLGHRAALLSQLAEQGHGGTFTFIDQVDAIALAFATALGTLFTCVAQNLSVKLEFDSSYAVTHSHSIYRHEPVQLPSSQVTFKLNDLNSEENRNLVFQLNVPALVEQSNNNDIIGHVSLEYTDAINRRQIQTPAVPFLLTRPAQLAPDSPLLVVSYAVDLQRNRAETSRVLKEAVNEPNYERARELLNTQLAKIRTSVSAQDPLCQQLIRDLEYHYTNPSQFATTMTNMYMQHGQERYTYSTATTMSANCYMTSGQERFRTLAARYK